ncbi:lipoate--protein ligase [Dethiothermospora halolimnae]|uniref:lipoate--protein ligase n=1 Tax=Dethiothermospora halolimnae TaxID=3114390 RepID=UPI003CCC3D32
MERFKMISIKNNNNDPHFNLALEEFALKYLDTDEDIIILWQNEPSVIIGRNQNTIEEINNKYIKENNINVVRRLSGGGAVYHDLGNLNFTFIAAGGKDNVSNFKKFTEPVIKVLKKLGINAEFSGRNDITIEGKKFSGNAQYYYKDKMLHHGTLLFNSDLTVVGDALKVKADKIKSKGVKSVRSRVTNIYPYLEEKISIEEFKDFLLNSILKEQNSLGKEHILTEQELLKIKEMMAKRYLTWGWNYGESPDFDIEKSRRYSGGNLDIRLDVKRGVIEDCKIFGDFFGNKDISGLEDKLIGKKYEVEVIRELLDNINLNEFIFNISEDEFIECMFY